MRTDAEAAQAVLDAVESCDAGEPRCSDDDLATIWRDPECDLERNWWLILTTEGERAAVAWLWPEMAGDVLADWRVHPDHRGRGLGPWLLAAVEARTAELSLAADGGEHRLVVYCEERDAARREELVRCDFTAQREFFEMSVDLRRPFPQPHCPDGVTMRPYCSGDEASLHAADEEAFAEHFLAEVISFEQWCLHFFEAEGSDPSLWVLAWDGGELVGFIIPAVSEHGAAIRELAVRKPWRGRGIARFLLAAAFCELRRRGETVVRLDVDAQNVTGALRVYEAAGMRVRRRFDVMGKRLA